MEDEGHPSLRDGRHREVDPPPDPAHELLHPLADGDVPFAFGARLLAVFRRADRDHLDRTEELGHRDVPGYVAPAHSVQIGHPLCLGPVIEDQGVEDRHAEPLERLDEGVGVAGRRERPCVDERIDPARKEGLEHLPVGQGPDIPVRNSKAEDRENVVIVLKSPDQGVHDGKVPVHPVRPGEEETHPRRVPGGVPGKIVVGVVEDGTGVRVVDPFPAGLLRGVVSDVHPAHLGLDVADQVPDVLRPAVEEVGAHRGDDGERDGRGRP